MENENKKPWYEDRAIKTQIRWYSFFGGAVSLAMSFLLQTPSLAGVGFVGLVVALVLWLGSLG